MSNRIHVYPATRPPEFDIRVNGRTVHFEWHPYCGPTELKKDGDPKIKQTYSFLEAASLWHAQGRKMKDGLCVWRNEPEPFV